MAIQIKAPKALRFTFHAQCITKDNQLAKVTVCVNYLSTVTQDDWLYARIKENLQRAADDYVIDHYLYDVTTDRNQAKDLVKKMNDIVKAGLKLDPKPAPTIKLDEVMVTIRRAK